MYLVKIINDNIETYINTVNISPEAPRITGSIKKGINTIDSFTFNILPNNPGYNKVNVLKTLVEVINTKNNSLEFKGRILIPNDSMNSSGLFLKSFICESELGYLMDSTQMYHEVHNTSVREYLKLLIDSHNSQVEEYKQFQLGNVDVYDSNDSLYRYIAYKSTWENIKEDLIDKLGGEIRIRYVNNIKYLDYVQEIGSVKSTDIRISKNLQTIEREQDPTQIITRLTPLGAKLTKTIVNDDGNEEEVETDERLTIASVNNNITYIDDDEAISKFDIIGKPVIFDGINYPDILLKKGLEYLSSNNRIKKKHSINALDLSLIGIDIDNIDIYNYYHVIVPPMGINEHLRVIEKTISIDKPHTSTITIGDKFDDIKQYQLNIIKEAKSLKQANDEIKGTIRKVENFTTEEIYRVDDRMNSIVVDVNNGFVDLNNGLNGTNTSLIELDESIKTLNGKVNINTNNIKTIESDLGTIKTDISNIKTNVETIKKDVTTIKTDIATINTKVAKIDAIEEKIDAILEIIQTP